MTEKQKAKKTEEEWKESLSPLEFCVLRQKGTEPPFTGSLLDNKKKGVYRCAGRGSELFESDAQFDSGGGIVSNCVIKSEISSFMFQSSPWDAIG